MKSDTIRQSLNNPVTLFAEAELSAERGDWQNVAAALHRLLRMGVRIVFTPPTCTTITI